jgi:hypothetical protein
LRIEGEAGDRQPTAIGLRALHGTGQIAIERS